MNLRSLRLVFTAGILCALIVGRGRAEFDLVYSYQNASQFTQSQRQILDEALAAAEALWERVITGYQPGIAVDSVNIQLRAVSTGLAAANFTGSVLQGGYRLATSGFINVNTGAIETFASGVDPAGNFNTGFNYMDELLAHETGHVLGIGTLWDDNNVYVNISFQYTGAHGLAAYQREFDADATFVPVENAGSPGTANSHWDQLMRSSSQEGNPADPWSLSPLTGIKDQLGRDLGLELMTGAIDPDYGEPFLSRTTVHSMRDLGYTVVPEPSTLVLFFLSAGWSVGRRRQSLCTTEH